MCRKWPNTRWACYETRRCRPQHPLLPGFDLGPAPWEEHCNQYDYFLQKCGRGARREGRTDDEINQPVYLTVECPRHHYKRMAHLKEAWDEEWRVQIIEAHPGDEYRAVALARKAIEDGRRDATIAECRWEAEEFKTPFYSTIHRWQLDLIRKVLEEGSRELPVLPDKDRRKAREMLVNSNRPTDLPATGDKTPEPKATDDKTPPKPAPDREDPDKTPVKRGFRSLFENRGKKLLWWPKKSDKANEQHAAESSEQDSAMTSKRSRGWHARRRNRSYSFSANRSDLFTKDWKDIFRRDRGRDEDGDDGYQTT
ncbi:hypothetical protein B0H67DRAFT_552483 [Lasiosphaeris hirsuta]|uniref:Uncharacterized protein n=1 Tax=Lasiosphaeris hirsuta TaxID=260670 RepID=A0AA40AQR2_9PEZI|nr:hypothetical protein B0H67DRAFT_552483 [Lasiosphaeris hirsuta]